MSSRFDVHADLLDTAVEPSRCGHPLPRRKIPPVSVKVSKVQNTCACDKVEELIAPNADRTCQRLIRRALIFMSCDNHQQARSSSPIACGFRQAYSVYTMLIVTLRIIKMCIAIAYLPTGAESACAAARSQRRGVYRIREAVRKKSERREA
eukprot:2083281-Pleurochrysis_carterae.AAC.2